LLNHAERRALESDRGEIRLQTNEAFAANLKLYAKCGYAINRSEPFQGGTIVHMSKRLAVPPLPGGYRLESSS
jgi:hypothetical protein